MKATLRNLFVTCLLLLSVVAVAQEAANPADGLTDEAIKKANNPLATGKTLNLQDYYVPLHFGTPGFVANQMLIRYSQSIGKVLLRGTLPFGYSAQRLRSPVSGLGDFNMFALYLFSVKGNQFGFGPNFTAPTGFNNVGAGKWQVGPSLLAFFGKSHIIQTGGLLQWQKSFAGDDDRPGVNLFTAQMFAIFQAGHGTYFRSTGVWSFYFNNENYNVPIGFGIGKVIKSKKVVFNVFIEPQFTVLADGRGQPLFQTFFGFNSQF